MKRLTVLSFLVLAGSAALFGVTATRRLAAMDTKGPQINMESETIELSINDQEQKLLEGVSAQDNRDGDVTDTLVVESISGFLEDKSRVITYAAFDNSNNVTKATRTMQYTDYTPIKISMTEPLRFPVSSKGNTDMLAHIGAWDCIQGDITEKLNVQTDDTLTYDVAGEYPITLTISNSLDDKESFPLTVTYYDPTTENAAPQIQLTDYLIYTKKGTVLNPQEYLDSIKIGGTSYVPTMESGKYGTDTSEMDSDQRKTYDALDPTISYDYITILDETDYNTPGTYEIKYVVRDADDHVGSVYLVVIVEEG